MLWQFVNAPPRSPYRRGVDSLLYFAMMQTLWQKRFGPSRTGWALLLASLTAVLSRFYQLGTAPPGLYRDEAFNGLDALAVLDGELAVFFTANNGREPGYIYLTAVAIALLGRTPLAIRIGAAIVGSLTTLVIYRLGKSWFGSQTAVYAAWLWAITLWPIHLSRIGLRPILLPIMLGLTFWLGTAAYRKGSTWLWGLAGAAYGLSFYTYLAIRFTPLLLGLILLYLWWQKRPFPPWKQLLAFLGGAMAVLSPLILWIAQDPSRILGRSNQVSILNPTINGGNLWGTLWLNIWRGVGLLFWQGDTILRHNPAGRPVFDWVMLIPLIVGIIYCVRHWKRPSAAILLLWTLTMLGPTILAEDTPHFLRAVGILPAIIYFPALGLNQIATRIPRYSQPVVAALLLLSFVITINDYRIYSQDPEVSLLFEAAALDLAEKIGAEDDNTAVYLDQWFWDGEQNGWPTLPFIASLDTVTLYRPELGVPTPPDNQAVSIYGWPYGSLDYVPTLIQPPAAVLAEQGPFARGDLEAEAYPLYVNYRTLTPDPAPSFEAAFGDQYRLLSSHLMQVEDELIVTLLWDTQTAVLPGRVIFTHLIGPSGTIAQDDAPPADGLWHQPWWQPGLQLYDIRSFTLPDPFDPSTHHLSIGVYNAATGVRLPVTTPSGEAQGDSWQIDLGSS